MAKTVVIGCKIPNGINLQLRGEINPTSAGCDILWEHKLKGSAQAVPPFVLEDGAGITMVPEEEWLAWEAWAEASKYPPYVKGLVFAADKLVEVKAEAKDKRSVLTGLEGLDLPLQPDAPPSKDPRLASFRKEVAPSVALV